MKLLTETRTSRTPSVPVNVLKTLGQIVAFWGFFLWVVPTGIIEVEHRLGWTPLPIPSGIGWALFGVASVLGLWSGMIFAVKGGGTPLPLDTTTQLVVLGPYRVLRNPMALAGITQGIAVGLARGSPTTVLYSLAGAVAWHIFARPWEESDLERRFGDQYRKYREAVPLWRPRLKLYPQVTAGPLTEISPDRLGPLGHATQDDETRP